MVHHSAGSGITGDMADGKTVLDHIVILPEVIEDNLMTAGNVHAKGDAFHDLALGKVLQGDGNVVGRVYLNVLHD